MTIQDLSFLITYGVCALVGLTCSIIYIIKAKTKEKVKEGVTWAFVSLTPATMVLGLLVIVGLFYLIIIESPAYLINKIKKLDK